jgi:hypothetical protein
MSEFSEQVSDAIAPTLATKVSYAASGAGLVVAGLTISEVVGVAIGITSIVTMIYTARANARHKRRAIELLDIQIKNENEKLSERELSLNEDD